MGVVLPAFPLGGCGACGSTGTTALIAVASLWLALAIDSRFGEPAARWHPVVWIGHYLGWIGRRIAPPAAAADARRAAPFCAGALAWSAGAVMVLGAALALQAVAQQLPGWLAWLLLGSALKPLLAWRMLRDEVLAVEVGLGSSLALGRAQLARLVSRDVSSLSETEVRESAIESLAENLNDSVVAPVFWFVLLGLPGAALYRFANTADAMWGYRGERGGRDWTWAGKWAARVDDGLSWVPARLTALLLCAVGGPARVGIQALCQEAVKTPSPNSGWPMAAMALLLGVRLRKPGVYTLHPLGRAPLAADTRRAATLAARSVLALAVMVSLMASLMVAGAAAFHSA